MNIGLLGGTYNPPHNGHLAIAQQVLDFTDVQEVWFLPNYTQNPPKPSASVEHRVTMTELLSKQSAQNNIKISNLEIEHKLSGQTIELIPFLPKEHSYRFIIGSDQLPTFHLWGKWEQLLKEIPFLIFPRYGYPNEPLYPGMTMINDSTLIVSNISSTKIRERVKRGLAIDQFVPQSVSAYITENNLYK